MFTYCTLGLHIQLNKHSNTTNALHLSPTCLLARLLAHTISVPPRLAAPPTSTFFFFHSFGHHSDTSSGVIIHIFLYHRRISEWKRTTELLMITVPWHPYLVHTLAYIHTDSFTFVLSHSKRRDASCSFFFCELCHLSAAYRPSFTSPILPRKRVDS